MKSFLFSCFLVLIFNSILFANTSGDPNILIAPGTLTDRSVTILWEKMGPGVRYAIYLNGKRVGTTRKTNFTIRHLRASEACQVIVSMASQGTAAREHRSYSISFQAAARPEVFNILDYGARNDVNFLNTQAIQATIDACTEGGVVVIPKGNFVSGALFLKSNMTLRIEKGGTLRGSESLSDYLPMIRNRFEGWEMDTYASLLNAGTLDHHGGYSVSNLRITGEGTIAGGGRRLGKKMIEAHGLRSRGRLILLMNCENVCISGLTITDPPSWTIHYIYSNNITCHDLSIITYGIANGDGIDPDSSTNAYIFNCRFDTGDDCIAIKSGKNPEGYHIAKPTAHVWISDCNFKRGHGISIGSEMSGGVSDIRVQDCEAGNLLNGLQVKATAKRGGYVKDITVTNCALRKITVFSSLTYNNDGEAAPEPPVFSHFLFRDIKMTHASTREPVININGFKKPGYRLQEVAFENIRLPKNAKVVVNDAEKINFSDVTCVDGNQPGYEMGNTEDVHY